jgi:PHS family inorganic phosphate transporter-like MFS transporter
MQRYRKSLPTLGEFYRYFKIRRNLKILLGSAGSWFFLDIAFCGLDLNSRTILSRIGFSADGNVYELLRNAAIGQLVLVCAGAIPGYFLTIFTIDIIGRKTIQLGGFLMLTLLFAIIGFSFNRLSQHSLLVLYILSQFFFNFGKARSRCASHKLLLISKIGPNATTFIVPSECFPTRLRAPPTASLLPPARSEPSSLSLCSHPCLDEGPHPRIRIHG